MTIKVVATTLQPLKPVFYGAAFCLGQMIEVNHTAETIEKMVRTMIVCGGFGYDVKSRDVSSD